MSGFQPKTYEEFYLQISSACDELQNSLSDAKRAKWQSGYADEGRNASYMIAKGMIEHTFPSRVPIALRTGGNWNPLAKQYNGWISDFRSLCEEGSVVTFEQLESFAQKLKKYIEEAKDV